MPACPSSQLEISDKLDITRFSPNDVLVTPDFKIRIHSDIAKTIGEFSKAFPRESQNINTFFNWIVNSKFPSIFSETQSLTFRNILDKYFNDERLKQALTMPLGNIGLSSNQASAITSIVLYREYMLDGGYYPRGGVQQLPNLLAEEFCKRGGVLSVSTKAAQIRVERGAAQGVVLADGTYCEATYVISASDAKHTFLKLIADEFVPANVKSRMRSLVPSMSAFIVYMGIENSLKNQIEDHCSHWVSPNYMIDDSCRIFRLCLLSY